MRALVAVCALVVAAPTLADRGPLVDTFVSVDAPVVALRHVRVIDGTGAAPREDQTIVVRDGKIAAVGAAATTPIPDGATTLDLAGKTVIPGLVGMHEHLFYPPKLVVGPFMAATSFYVPQPYSFPRLYLAAGVTTARTAGSMSPYLDLALKREIDAGRMPGPRLDVSGPYIEGPHPLLAQMPAQADAASVRRFVDYWVGEGVTSFKVYNVVTRAQLAAAVDEAHKHHVKVAGHLCSIGFREAAAAGIDSLEHGLDVDTEFFAGKQPDVCPRGAAASLPAADSPEVKALIADAQKSVTNAHAAFARMMPDAAAGLKREMAFERAFVKAGGLLLAGCDPTGDGSVLAGFGDQRNLELLVKAGFSPVEAIHIGTQNGARFLERDDLGVIAPGKRADLVVLDGNPARDIKDVEKVVTVFKDGLGFDAKALVDAVRGNVGLR